MINMVSLLAVCFLGIKERTDKVDILYLQQLQ